MWLFVLQRFHLLFSALQLSFQLQVEREYNGSRDSKMTSYIWSSKDQAGGLLLPGRRSAWTSRVSLEGREPEATAMATPMSVSGLPCSWREGVEHIAFHGEKWNSPGKQRVPVPRARVEAQLHSFLTRTSDIIWHRFQTQGAVHPVESSFTQSQAWLWTAFTNNISCNIPIMTFQGNTWTYMEIQHACLHACMYM